MSETRALVVEDSESERSSEAPRGLSRRAASLVALSVLSALVLGCIALARTSQNGSVAQRAFGEELTKLEEVHDDDKEGCDKYPYLKFEVPHAVIYNNLANKGPDSGRGEGIVYKTIDLGKAAGKELDREVYMTVNASKDSELWYKPFSSRLNGMQGKYGSINLQSGTELDLLFNFYDRETMEQLTLPEFAMTWFDLDTGDNGHSAEYVILGGFKSYHVRKTTEVDIRKDGDGRTKFQATKVGTGSDNPKDPNFLTEQQENRAVTVLFGPTKEVRVTIGATMGKGPRFFTFVGRPSLLCATTVKNKDYKPPLDDLTFHPPMQDAIFAGQHDEFVSFSVKKGDKVKKGDLIATTKKDDKPQEYRADHDGTIIQIQDKLKPGDHVDERLSEKIVAVIERPSVKRLLQDANSVPGGPGMDTGLPKEAVFKKYLVQPGDEVQKGDPIAVVEKREDGEEVEVKATDSGIVKERQEEMREGMLLRASPDGNLITLKPMLAVADSEPAEKLPPLPVEDGASPVSSDSTGKEKFVKYYVEPEDVVEKGEAIAQLEGEDGEKRDVLAPKTGVVKHTQEKLEKGMVLDEVLEDKNLATIDLLPALDVGPGQAGSFAPTDEEWQLKEWKVEEGDVVSKGDPVAVLEKPETGETTEVPAGLAGTVVARQKHLKAGDVVEECTPDSNMATIENKGPEIGFREVGVDVPSMDCSFEDWKVKDDDYVQTGDPIADVNCPSVGDGRRLVGMETITVPSPGTGWINYRADLKKGQTIKEAAASPTIARVNMGWPTWLTVLGVLLFLCCCLGLLFFLMPKPKASYKAMPPAPQQQEGVRLDFDDNGTRKTVYAKYRPLGIHHNRTAPIVVQSFTVNSYAKNGLGVQPDWKLVRIGDQELNDSSDFPEVSWKLRSHLKDYPVWPLPLEFRRSPDDPETLVHKFVERPLGMEFSNVAPIKVDRIHEDSPAADQNVEVGWFLTKIGDRDVHESHNFREVLQLLKQGAAGLNDSNKKYKMGTTNSNFAERPSTTSTCTNASHL